MICVNHFRIWKNSKKKRDNLIQIDYDFNEEHYYRDAEEIEAFLRNNVNYTDELRKRFVDYYKNPGDMLSYCGVSIYFSFV